MIPGTLPALRRRRLALDPCAERLLATTFIVTSLLKKTWFPAEALVHAFGATSGENRFA